MTAVVVPTAADLRKLLDDLLAHWGEGPEEVQTPRGVRMELVRIKTIITLAAHAHRLGRAVAVMTDAGLGLETAPTVRSVVEFGLTVQWMLQYGDDTSYGFATEARRQRRAMGNTIRKASETMQLGHVDDVLAHLDADAELVIELRKAATVSARQFFALCDDFAHGSGLYLVYRVLSESVHPGPSICDRYVDERDPPVFQLEPRPVNDDKTWLYNTCCGLVWAARATDCLDRARYKRTFLRGAAKQLGIPPELRLSSGAIVRREQERQQRKQREREAQQQERDRLRNEKRYRPPTSPAGPSA